MPTSPTRPSRAPGTRPAAWVALVLASCLAMVAAPGAELRADSPIQEDPPKGPKARLGEIDHSFKGLLQGEVFDYEVTIHNDGDQTLEIYKVVPSCHCIIEKSVDSVIAPGESGKLVIEINTKRIKADGTDQRKNVRLQTNDPVTPEVIFWFTAEVISLVQTNPARIEMTGVLDQPKETTVELIANTDLGFELVNVESREGHFEVAERQLVEKDKKYRVRLVAKPGKQPGTIQDPLDMTIRVRDGRTVTVGVWVYINHLDHILVLPTAVKFLNRDTDRLLVDNPAPVVKTITVAAADPKTKFQVTGVTLDSKPDGVFETEVVPVVDQQRYEIRVILREYQTKVYVRGKVTIETNDPRRPKIELDLQALFGKRR